MPEDTVVAESPVVTESAAPAVSSPEPSAPSQASPAAPSQASPAEFAAPPRNEGEINAQYLQRVRAEREKFESGKPKESPAAEAPKIQEPVAPKTEEAKPEEKKPEVAEPNPDALTDDEIEPEQGIATSELAAKLKDDPDLAAKLDAAGIKNQVFANARMADKYGAFAEEFPGGIEDAKFVKTQAEQFTALDEGVASITDVASAQNFLASLLPLSYVLDADGKPVPDGQGGFQTDGTIDKFIGNTVAFGISRQPDLAFRAVMDMPQGNDLLLNHLKSLATEGDDEAQAAVEILTERMQARPSGAKTEPTSVKEQQLAAKEAEIKAAEVRLNQQRQAADKQTAEGQERAVATDISSRMDKLIGSYLGKFNIPQFNLDSAEEKVRKALYERVVSDPTFKMQANQLSRRSYSEKVHTERVGLALKTAKSLIRDVANPITKAAGGELISKQEAKLAKINTQADTSRKAEPKGSSAPPSGQAPLTKEAAYAKAKESLISKGNLQPEGRQIIGEMRSLGLL